MFYQLPPAGNSIHFHRQADVSIASIFPGYSVQFYASGTTALAAALVAAIKKSESESAEVILPAYGCPDLISAVIYAGAKPVLVDLEEDRPWLCLAQLTSVLTTNTVAIIAVNLFGISERWKKLRLLIEQRNIVLVEDSAQYFPRHTDALQNWQGDMVVLSFGRGKPVSLLGGGAVLTKIPALFERLPESRQSLSGSAQRFSFALKARLYNGLISPYLYWLPEALPFLHLGETRYHALTDMAAMDQVRLGLLQGNISRYQNDMDAAYRVERISATLDALMKVQNLPKLCDSGVQSSLLRYPLLLDSSLRNLLYRKLKQAGLGASILYPASLPQIAGLHEILDDKQTFPNAEKFAAQLLTLPTHSRVSEKDLNQMNTILKQWL